MVKTQSLNNTERNTIVFFVAAAIIILTAFLLFTPKIAAKLFPFKRQAVYNNFLKTVQTDKKVNPQTFWEFREFYSPGYFTLSKAGLPMSETQKAERLIGIPLKPGAIELPFAFFQSEKTVSLDALSNKAMLSQVAANPNPGNIIFSNNSSLIYQEGGKTIKIIFIKPESEMKKAVGFFEYNDVDKKITQGKYWLNITTITLD